MDEATRVIAQRRHDCVKRTRFIFYFLNETTRQQLEAMRSTSSSAGRHPTSSSSSSSSSSTHSNDRTIIFSFKNPYYIWIIICSILIISWIITHRLVISYEAIHLENNQQLKELYFQTKTLFHEIAHNNLTINAPPILNLNPESVPLVEKNFQKCQAELVTAHEQLTKYENALSEKHTESSSKVNDKWLVIGIPTVARIHDEPYLLRTLESIASQLPTDPEDLLYNKVLVIVVNMQVNSNPDRKHTIYEEAKRKYSAAENPKLASSFLFTELLKSEILEDPIPGRNQQNDVGNANKPGFLVRRQTRNIVSVMKKSMNKGKYYLFLEDDMVLCQQGFYAVEYLLRKSNEYHPNWLAIRTSYGMNGIFMHDKDLDTFANYLLRHQVRRPPDHLVVEWYAGETPEAKQYKSGRANIGFKFNLFDHLGVVSTLRTQKSGSFPRCYELLAEPTVFKVEAYNPHECPHEDIWPCHNLKHKKIPNIDWSKV
jgi:hypothetical protein